MSVFKAHSDMAAALTPEIKVKPFRRVDASQNLVSCLLRQHAWAHYVRFNPINPAWSYDAENA